MPNLVADEGGGRRKHEAEALTRLRPKPKAKCAENNGDSRRGVERARLSRSIPDQSIAPFHQTPLGKTKSGGGAVCPASIVMT